MFNLILYVCFVSMISDVAMGRIINFPDVPDGISLHSVLMTWEEAKIQCQNEGAILASPITFELYIIMNTLIRASRSTFYIGTKVADRPQQYVSIEGVPLENMTVSTWRELDPWNGDCLAMSADGTVHTVQCDSRLPHICYNHRFTNKPSCGSSEKGYKYDNVTGNCYKIHPANIWSVAKTTCADEGGQLAIVKNAIEAQSINSMKEFYWIFIGLKQTGSGDWKTINDQPVEQLFNVWANGGKPANSNLQCGAIKRGGKLDDVNCNTNSIFICQKEPTV